MDPPCAGDLPLATRVEVHPYVLAGVLEKQHIMWDHGDLGAEPTHHADMESPRVVVPVGQGVRLGGFEDNVSVIGRLWLHEMGIMFHETSGLLAVAGV